VQVRSRPERERFGGHVYFAPTCVNACSITASNCPPTPAAYRERAAERAAERRDTDRRDRPIGSLARIPRASHNPRSPRVLFFARFGLSAARSRRRPGLTGRREFERVRERARDRNLCFYSASNVRKPRVPRNVILEMHKGDSGKTLGISRALRDRISS